MTALARNFPRLSAAEYLRLERQSSCKHEFVDGVVYAMAGATLRHNDITSNAHGVLRDRLPPTYRPYLLDAQVHIETTEAAGIGRARVAVEARAVVTASGRHPSTIAGVVGACEDRVDERRARPEPRGGERRRWSIEKRGSAGGLIS